MPPKLDSMYDRDWCLSSTSGTTGCHELRVEVVSAAAVGSPEWRLGDIARSLLQGRASLVQRVYVELQLGDVKFRSRSCELQQEGALSFSFNQELALFPYKSEMELQVRLYAKRGVQAALRGHPLVGEGRLQLGPELADLAPRQAEVVLQRKDVGAGSVTLGYRFMTPSGTTSTQSRPRTPSVANVGAAEYFTNDSSGTRHEELDELLDRIHDAGDEEQSMRAAEELFLHLDLDKTGALERQEYQQIMEALTSHAAARYDKLGMRGAFSREDVRTSIQYDLDVDFDGEVSKEEFMNNVKKILVQMDS